MAEKKEIKYFVVIITAVVLLAVGINILIYKVLKEDYTTKVELLESKVNRKIDFEHSYNEQQRYVLENKTLTNLISLQNSLSRETERLKLNLESQLGDVSSNLKEVKEQTESGLQDISDKVGGLESKISEIDVTSSDFSSIVEDVVKAVVSIRTDKGQASGVLFDKRGYIMTNKHVIDGIKAAAVIDYDSNSYPVQLVSQSSDEDLAILKIESESDLDYLGFADSSDVRVGNRVIAVGNPLGLSFSVTEGIVSAVNRKIDNTGIGYIQTDVSINKGNSGGPLVNSAKKIVGINTFKITETEGLGFAIPSNLAKDFADQSVT